MNQSSSQIIVQQTKLLDNEISNLSYALGLSQYRNLKLESANKKLLETIKELREQVASKLDIEPSAYTGQGKPIYRFKDVTIEIKG